MKVREACAIYVAKRLLRMPTVGGGESVNGGVPMGVVLKEIGLSVVEFVRELRFFVLSLEAYFNKYGVPGTGSAAACDTDAPAGAGPESERRLQVRQLELNLLYLCTLRSKYHSVVRALFRTESSSDVVVRFGWLLFILGKAKTLSEGPSMSDQIYLFVAMLEIVLANAPESYVRPLDQVTTIRDVPFVMVRDASGKVDTFASLCAFHKAAPGDVLPVLNGILQMLRDLLPAATSETLEPICGAMNKAPRFAGLINGAAAQANVNALEKAYDVVYLTSSELDERVFDGENVLLGDPRTLTPMHAGARVLNGAKATPGTSVGGRANPLIPSPWASGPTSPTCRHSGAPPRTPVSETMAASQWLRREVEQIEQCPTAQLRSVLDLG